MSFAPVKFRETAEFKKGDAGQREVARWFQRRGCHITPSYDYSGDNGDKAPKMQGFYTSYVIPDLDISRDGKRKWIEVKTYERPTFTRMTGRNEHGICLRHWKHYREVERITGTKVILCINEKCSGELLFASLDRLSKDTRIGILKGKETIFFPRNNFRIEKLNPSPLSDKSGRVPAPDSSYRLGGEGDAPRGINNAVA